MARPIESTTLSAMATQSEERTFHLFPELPFEIRLTVWELHEGRVIPIYPSQPKSHCFHAIPHHPPVLLHVNQETRELALKTHELVDLAPKHKNRRTSTWSESNATEKRSIRIDWNKDVLYATKLHPHLFDRPYQLPWHESHATHDHLGFIDLTDVPQLSKIKHIAIHQMFPGQPSQLCSILPLLSTITIIRRDETAHAGETGMENVGAARKDTNSFYLVKANEKDGGCIDDGYFREVLLRRLKEHHEKDIMTAKVRFCRLLYDHTRRNEKMEVEDGLEDMADITIDRPRE